MCHIYLQVGQKTVISMDSSIERTEAEVADECSDSHGNERSMEYIVSSFCQICGKDIRHLSTQRQTQHVNRCIDQVMYGRLMEL
jgi:hypothetical protein